jgi:hypothetical protein
MGKQPYGCRFADFLPHLRGQSSAWRRAQGYETTGKDGHRPDEEEKLPPPLLRGGSHGNYYYFYFQYGQALREVSKTVRWRWRQLAADIPVYTDAASTFTN